MTISQHTYRADLVYTQGVLPESVVLTENGGGPSGIPTRAWVKVPGWAGVYSWMAPGRSGGPYSWVLSTQPGDTTAAVSRVLTGLTPGRKYVVALWVKPSNVPMVSLGDAPREVFPGRWEQISHTFTATATTKTIRLTSTPGVAYATTLQFDDLKVIAYPYTLPAVVVPLDLKDGTITLDESWAPYAAANLTLPTPTDPTALARLDPRAKPRVVLTAVQDFGTAFPAAALPGAVATMTARFAGQSVLGISSSLSRGFNPEGVRPSTRRTWDLVVRSRTVDHLNGQTTLSATSDEGLLFDYAPPTTLVAAPTVRAAVTLALSRIAAFLVPGADDGPIEVGAAVWTPGTSAWQYVSPLVESAGLRLYCDEQRRWHLVKPLQASGAALFVSTSNIGQAEDQISRDEGWADAYTVVYRWTDDEGMPQVRYDVAAPTGYSKMEVVDVARPWVGDGAAAALLARAQGRGQATQVETVSDYKAAPGALLRVSLPGDPTLTGVVSRVEWRLASDDMSVRSRDLTETPERSWLAQPHGTTWTATRPGPWTTYTTPTQQGI